MEIADLDEQFDRLLALIPVAKDVEQLEHIGTLIDIDMTGIAGNRKALLRKIVTHLNSDDFDNNADRERLIISARDSMLTHLNIMPDLEGFQAAHDNGNLHVKENDSNDSEDSDHDSDAEYQDALNDLRKQKKDKKTASAAVMSASVKLKDFKISGTVGEPGEKGKLTYGSLAHQINTGIDRGFDETEVIAAVIRAITPGHTTRTYLEGKRKLTLAKLMSTMKAHFGEKDVTELYKDMTTAIQGTKQTPVKFLMSMFAMRDRVLELQQQNPGRERRYSRKLLQAEMQKGIYAGLRDESIRQDMKMMLRQPDVDDDELMNEMTNAVLSKEEHEKKLEEGKGKSNSAAVSMVCSGSCKANQPNNESKDNANNTDCNNNNNNLYANFVGRNASNLMVKKPQKGKT